MREVMEELRFGSYIRSPLSTTKRDFHEWEKRQRKREREKLRKRERKCEKEKNAFIIRPRARRRSQKQWENESHGGPARSSTTFGCRSRVRLKAPYIPSDGTCMHVHRHCIFGPIRE